MTIRRDPIKWADLDELVPIGYHLQCDRCGAEFIARQDARFCSNACRVAARRARAAQNGESQ